MRYTVSGADTLQKRVTEASGRTIPQSTIDDVVRALGLTAKVAERVHPGRDPIASAQVRQDVNSYPLLCVTNLDATHIAPEDYIRPVGRAPRGKKARLRANAINPGGYSGLRTLYAAMNTGGMVEHRRRHRQRGVPGLGNDKPAPAAPALRPAATRAQLGVAAGQRGVSSPARVFGAAPEEGGEGDLPDPVRPELRADRARESPGARQPPVSSLVSSQPESDV